MPPAARTQAPAPAAGPRAASPERPREPLRPGAAIESRASGLRYAAERLLGAGAFGSVWLCRTARGERRAVKLLPAERPQDLAVEVALSMRALEAAGEYCVPKFYEASEASIVGRRGTQLLIAMEFISGATARKLCRAAPLPEVCAKAVMVDVAAALGRLHSHGLLHRDVKAENVIVSYQGSSYLCDFGISAHEEELRARGVLQLRAGTPDHMAPEITSKYRIPHFTQKVDVWAFGIFVLELARGNTPLEERRCGNRVEAMLEITSVNAAPAVPRCRGFSSSFVDFVENCLVRDPAKRHTIHEVLQSGYLRHAGGRGYIAVQRHLASPDVRRQLEQDS